MSVQRNSEHEIESLTESVARVLLLEAGYVMNTRFDHIHAMTDSGEELHICLVPDLASMSATRFLACLEEAKKQTVQSVLGLIPSKKMRRVEGDTVRT